MRIIEVGSFVIKSELKIRKLRKQWNDTIEDDKPDAAS